ncbi:MAG: hypothetical protein P8H59_10000 [Flavobacteriales bacterium]|nr:hypothetical protein [Flavobacteriales bacterium]MDG1781274.1 hypothetical protein [Flavobacteriales bacterium]MDG2244767.1 hypothetical protein [Flavobacteriales bacterium]
MKEIYLKIWMVLAPIIFALSYFLSSRIQLRAKQIGANSMDVQEDNGPWIYASFVVAAFTIVYYFIARDLSKHD